MPADPTDRKAMLRERWDAAQDEEETTPATEEAPEEVEETAAEEEPAEAAPETETAEQQEARERDEQGRFKPKEGKTEKPAAASRAVTQAAQTAPAAVQGKAADAGVKPATPAPAAVPAKPDAAHPDLVAPRSWTAGEREAWRKAPADIRKTLYPAIMRAEQESQRVRQEFGSLQRQAGEAQQFRQGVESFVKPYEGLFRAQGMEPMQGVASVVDTYAALHFGSPAQKAGILANLLTQFSDVDSVNAVLSGQAPAAPAGPAYRQPAQARPAAPPVDARAIVREELQAFRDQAVSAKADRDWQSFTGAGPEFLDVPGVQDNMQTVLDAAHARGRNLTYQQAYDLALKMDPEIQGILEQRAQAAAVTAQQSATAPTARARAAAATVRSRPTQVGGDEPDLSDRRAVIARMAGRSR